MRHFTTLSDARKKVLLRVVAGMSNQDAELALARLNRIPPKALAAHLHARVSNDASLIGLLRGNKVERDAVHLDLPASGPLWKAAARRRPNIDGLGRPFGDIHAPLRAWVDDDQQADDAQDADNDAQQADNVGGQAELDDAQQDQEYAQDNGNNAQENDAYAQEAEIDDVDNTVRDDAYGVTVNRTVAQDDNHLYDQDAFINDADKNAMIDRAFQVAQAVLGAAAVYALAALFVAVLHPPHYGGRERRALNELGRRVGEGPRKGASAAELSSFRAAVLATLPKRRSGR